MGVRYYHRGLKAFLEDYPEAEAALVYRGEERRRIDDIWCIPAEEFLPGITHDHPIRFDK